MFFKAIRSIIKVILSFAGIIYLREKFIKRKNSAFYKYDVDSLYDDENDKVESYEKSENNVIVQDNNDSSDRL